jgi:uncharacterized protein (TIGR02145 family)
MKSRTASYEIIVLSILIMIMSTCKKEEIGRDKPQTTVEDAGIKINKEQKIVNLENSDITEVTTIDTILYNSKKLPKYQIVIEGNADDVSEIEIGTIIYIPKGDKGGILVFVTEVGSDDGSIKSKGLIRIAVKGYQATLGMYFNQENATLKFSSPDNRSKRALDIPNKLEGENLVFVDEKISFNIGKGEDLDLQFSSMPDTICKLSISNKIWKSGDSYVLVEGTIGIQPAIDFFMRYEPVESGSKLWEYLKAMTVSDAFLILYRDKNYFSGNMKELKANIYTDINTKMKVRFHLAEEFKKKDPIKVPIGILTVPSSPVSTKVKFAFEIDLKAAAALDLELYNKEEYDIAVGVDLTRDLPETIWYLEKNHRKEGGIILKAEVAMTAGLSLILETEAYVMGFLGPAIKVGGFIEGTAIVEGNVGTSDPISSNWKLSADAGLRVGASLDLSVFHNDKATWKILDTTFITYRQNIYKAPDHLKVETGDNQFGFCGQVLKYPIEIGVYDSRDAIVNYLPVPVFFEPKDGSTEPSGVVLSQNGKSTVRWTLGNNNEPQILKAYFKDGENKEGEVQINAIAQESNFETGTLTDSRDGKIYKTVKIGNQWWMAENLAYLPAVSPTFMGSGSAKHYYVYGYDGSDVNAAKSKDNYRAYGVLYNWLAAMDGSSSSSANPSGVRGVSPEGWHLPSEAEWTQLENYLADNGYNYDGTFGSGVYKIGKSMAATTQWNTSSNSGAVGNDLLTNNRSGFSGLPGGSRDGIVGFSGVQNYGYWWSSTENSNDAWVRYLIYSAASISHTSFNQTKAHGYSVRCVKD